MKKIFTFVLLCAAMMMGTAKAETVEIKANFGYAIYYEESADWYIVLQDEETGNLATLDFFSEDYTSIVGELSDEDFDMNYTAIRNSEGKFKATSAKATISRKGNVTTIAATVVAEDGNTYNVTYSDQFYGMEVDAEESENTVYELAYDDEAEMTVLYIDALDGDAEAGNEIILYFPGLSAEAETLNTGVYTIDDSGKAGTVFAEYSMVDAYSWYDDEAEPDFYLDDLFTLVSGTVTISEEEGVNVVVVEGVDYVGSSIYLSFTGDLSDIISSETGIKSAAVKAKAEKSVRNGQLIIKRQNVEYNALGAIVK